jgi:peptidoglycan hydrolase CwlO-like protein
MGLFGLFKSKKTIPRKNKQTASNKRQSQSSVNRLQKKTYRLSHQLDTVNVAIKHLQEKTDSHDNFINTNREKLQTLEQRLTPNQSIYLPRQTINQNKPNPAGLNTVFNRDNLTKTAFGVL